MPGDRRSRGRSKDSRDRERESRTLQATIDPAAESGGEAPRPAGPALLLAGFALLWRRPWWLVALIVTLSGGVAVSGYLRDDPRPLVLGQTSDGHRLMERSCASCHVPWKRPDAARCADCHQAELARDHHAATKFANVARWGDLFERLDPRDCVTCHREHRPAEMGFTAAPAICRECHADIAETAPDHKGFSFDGCLGCHNYHDESAIAPAEVARRRGEPATRSPSPEDWLAPSPTRVPPPASPPAPDAPAEILRTAGAAVAEWGASAHATAGVNCSTCHTGGPGRSGDGSGWIARPDETSCAPCHDPEVNTYHRGRHGMRAGTLGEPLAVRDPDVRLPMRQDAPERQGCGACHGVHGLDLERAQVAACLSCHDDEHSRNYESSPHGRARAAGRADAPTCASCHLVDHPETDPVSGAPRRVTDHNNSFTMRPAERMLGEVCSKCHSLALGWSAVRSPAAAQKNFAWHPADPEVERYLQMVDDRTRARGGRTGEKEDRR
ncbi:MAG TPA: cytochrome c3 family protein [Polyangia bacterium]|nr:cytochrome c3 family protein [Polyangia bacterium]